MDCPVHALYKICRLITLFLAGKSLGDWSALKTKRISAPKLLDDRLLIYESSSIVIALVTVR
jgi:hypothetical protein